MRFTKYPSNHSRSNPKFISIHFRRNRRHQIINPITWILFRSTANQVLPLKYSLKLCNLFSIGPIGDVLSCCAIEIADLKDGSMFEVTYRFKITRLSRVRIHYRACQQSAA